jgi:murein DD-endopeptidase MepM/ murein hydrolase activator NlpD
MLLMLRRIACNFRMEEMNKAGTGKKILIILYLAAIHIAFGLLLYERFFTTENAEKSQINEVVPLPTPLEIPFEDSSFAANSQAVNQPPTNVNNSTQNINNSIQNANQAENRQTTIVLPTSDKLMIPVVGIKKESLTDTFNDARSENRVHNAIDIMAPQGTPVVAAADGEIARFFDSNLGGITIYQFSKDKKFIYYYAHLQKRADGLEEKVFVPQGKVIGYVGDTGNAGAGNFHLHFSISIPSSPQRYWEGENINPFPLLKEGVEATAR